jgi:hypothetical protein
VADGDKRVELVRRETPGGHRTQRIGIGLLLSLVLGVGPLNDAFRGNGSFEHAMGRFLFCVGVGVGAVLMLGRLLDAAHETQPGEHGESSDTGRSSTADSPPTR